MPEKYTIAPDDILYRRFSILDHPNYQVFWKWNNGIKVPTSAAFKTKQNENGLSVDIAALTTPEKSVLDPLKFGIAEISATIPISLSFTCVHDPMPGNEAHALILGDTNPIAKKLSRSITNVIILNK